MKSKVVASNVPASPNVEHAVRSLAEAFEKDGIPVAGILVAAAPYSEYVQRTGIHTWLGATFDRLAGVIREDVPRVDIERALLEQARDAIDERIRLLNKEAQ